MTITEIQKLIQKILTKRLEGIKVDADDVAEATETLVETLDDEGLLVLEEEEEVEEDPEDEDEEE